MRGLSLSLLVIFTFVNIAYSQIQTANTDFHVPNEIVGYLTYLPDGYESSTSKYPLLVFLHGAGERSASDVANLNLLKKTGLPEIIEAGKQIPMIVISPQAKWTWDNSQQSVDLLVDFLINKYRVDESRIYLTGISAGGKGVFYYSNSYPNKVAAIIPVSTWPVGDVNNFKDIPAWSFMGSGDTYGGLSDFTKQLNNIGGAAEFTLYAGGHSESVWNAVYSGTKGDDIYSWLLNKYNNKTSINENVTVDIGPDFSIELAANTMISLPSDVTSAYKIQEYNWTKISGPEAKLTNYDTPELIISDYLEGDYVFGLTASDMNGNTGYDEVTMTVTKTSSTDVTLRNPDEPLNTKQGLTYKYYEGIWTSMPDMESIKSVSTGEIDNFFLSPRLREDLFAFQFTGFIEAPADNEYTFYLGSDDGSRLYIGNQLVVDNDNTHGYIEKSGRIGLKKGMHAIKVEYFESKYANTLSVSWSSNLLTKQPIPNTALIHEDQSANIAPEVASQGLEYFYYEGLWSQIPDYNNESVIKRGYTDSFELSNRNKDDYFGFLFKGFIKVDYSGEYTFIIGSDDGSKLFIDDQLVVNNDGTHGYEEKAGKVLLNAGLHPIKVEFFDRTHQNQLNVYWQFDSNNKSPIPNEVLYRNNSESNTRKAQPILSSTIKDEFNKGLQISVYPNPVEDNLTIEIPSDLLNNNQTLNFKLIDLMGNIVKDYPIYRSGTMRIDVTGLKNTTYVYFISSSDQVLFRSKLVKLTD